MSVTPLDHTALEALITEVQEVPNEVDGIDLAPPRQEAIFQLSQARNSLLRLRKLATPLGGE